MGMDVIADAVAESRDPVYEPGIPEDVQCADCGLADRAVVCAQAAARLLAARIMATIILD
jgi:hypothetical protein